MLLQPFVENSIKYAVERSPNPTKIMLNAKVDHDQLFISLKDETKNYGMPVQFSKGIGLSNAEERLHKLYGDQCKFILNPYTHNGNCGMEVNITIPAQYENV
jgi:LytS/YehU family sensor histidine kinase